MDGADRRDRDAIVALFDRCSRQTVQDRFFAPIRAMPSGYLDGAVAGDPYVHDAVVCRRDASVVGLASLAVVPDCGSPTVELGVLIEDAWQRHGIGAAMTEVLFGRARLRKVRTVRAEVLAGRTELLAALGKTLRLVHTVSTEEGVMADFTLPGN